MDEVIQRISGQERVVITDFKRQVGDRNRGDEEVMGRFVVQNKKTDGGGQEKCAIAEIHFFPENRGALSDIKVEEHKLITSCADSVLKELSKSRVWGGYSQT